VGEALVRPCCIERKAQQPFINLNTNPIAQVIRTRSRHYVTYSLLAFARAATFAKNAGEDVLITYEGPQKQSLKHGTLSKPNPNQSNPTESAHGRHWVHCLVG
jgi:hypothetical protein